MRSEWKCSIFDLLWPDPSILEAESEKFVFLENKNTFEEKKTQPFLSYKSLLVCKNWDNLNFLPLP